jgi:hypothetical protein
MEDVRIRAVACRDRDGELLRRCLLRPSGGGRLRGAQPAYRTNGCYLGFWFRFTPRNVAAPARAVARKRWRGGSQGGPL